MVVLGAIFGFLFVAALLGVGWYSSRRLVLNESAYLLANREVGLFGLTATLVMTELNTSTLTAFASFGYLCGLWALALPCIFLFALSFYAFVVAKKWRGIGGLSVAELFTRHYGSAVGKMASAMLLSAMAAFTANYIKSLTLIFSSLAPRIPHVYLSTMLVILTLAVTSRRGLLSVVHTNIASLCSVCCILPLVAYYSWGEGPPPVHLDMDMKLLPPTYVLSLILLCMFTYISAPWYGQKIFAARTKQIAFWASVLSTLFVVAFYSICIVIAACMKKTGVVLASPDLTLPYLISNLPPLVRGVGYAVLFAITATTLSSVWNAMAGMVIGDFLGGTLAKDCRRSMGLTIAFASISLLLANIFIDAIFAKLILANIPILSLSFALLAAFYWPPTSRSAAVASISVGLAWGLFTYFYFGEAGGYITYWVMGGIPLIFGTGIAVSLARPKVYMRSD